MPRLSAVLEIGGDVSMRAGGKGWFRPQWVV